MKKIFSDFEYKAASVFFAIMLVLMLTSVGMRIFSTGLTWGEELSRYSVFWGVCIGIVGGVKAREHIYIDFIVEKLPRKLSYGMKLLNHVVEFGMYLFVTYYAYQFVLATIKSNQLTPSLRWPMWIVYLALPLGFLASSARKIPFVIQAAKDFKAQSSTAEESAISRG